MQKQIHVSSYVKRDGTQVKEHYRNIDTDNYGTGLISPDYPDYPVMDEKNNNQVKNLLSNIFNPTMGMDSISPVLQGGVSVDVGFPTGGAMGDVLGNIGGVLGAVAAVGLELAPIVLQMYQEMNSGNGQAVEYLKPQFNTKIKQMDTKVAQMKTNIDNNITKLVNAKNQVEYSKIYEPLQKDWQEYQHAKNIVNRIKTHASNGDFQSVANDLGNFVSNSHAGKAIMNNPIMQNVITNLQQESSKILNAENIDNLLKNSAKTGILNYNNFPFPRKYYYDFAVKNLAQFANDTLNASRPEARQFMDLSLNLPEDTYSNSKYSMIQPIFNEKLNEYLRKIGTDLQVTKNMKGIVFDKSSQISQKLSNFEQLQKDIRAKYNQDTKFISGLGINTDTNLQYAVGHFTILNPRIENGVFKGELFDIYDYHWLTKKELKDFLILFANNMAFLLQLSEYLMKYYFIIPIEFRY